MKPVRFFIFLFFNFISIISGNATQPIETEVSQPSLFKMSLQMERLRKDGQWLEAMDTATLILNFDQDNRSATDFVYRYWDKTMKLTDERLQRLSDEQNLEQAKERCEIYRVLDEIHDHLRQIKMPLYGPNQKWVWQPEIGYYTGHYDAERTKTYHLLLNYADKALKNYDVAEATLYYQTALDKYLLTDKERNGNKNNIVMQCNRLIEQYRNSTKIYNAIFAYDLCRLSLQLEPNQAEISSKQAEIQQHIASLYLKEAEAALQAGDSVQAYEMRLSYEEWNISITDEETDNR